MRGRSVRRASRGRVRGESHGREGQQEIRARPPVGRQAISAADDEHQIAAFHLHSLDESDKLGGIPALSGGIEQHFEGRRRFVPPVVAPIRDFTHLAFAVAGGPFEELFSKCVEVGVAGLADKQD